MVNTPNIRKVLKELPGGDVLDVRTTLETWDPQFATIVGHVNFSVPQDEWVQWNNLVNVDYVPDEEQVAYKIKQTPGTIAFLVESDAESLTISKVSIYSNFESAPEYVVECTGKTIKKGIEEIGLHYGNNGDLKKHHTLSLSGAFGREAWPLITTVYLLVRKQMVRPGSCK